VIGVALGFLRGVSLRTWLAIGGAVVLLVAGLWLRAHWIGVGEGRVQARWDAQEAVYARQRAEAITAARVLEERHRAELKAVADRFQAEQRKADEDHAAAVAAVRSGAVRVRERFRCPAPAGMPATAADPGGADAAGPRGLQPADLEYLLGIGAEADAIARRLNALQEACRR
jgi:hypothetical protein